jgi:hypothetical protein
MIYLYFVIFVGNVKAKNSNPTTDICSAVYKGGTMVFTGLVPISELNPNFPISSPLNASIEGCQAPVA